MLLYKLLLLEDNLYNNIAVIGDKKIYEELKSKVNPEFVDIDFFEKFEDYPRKPRIYRRVINSIKDVDYKIIYESIHHQGWLVTTPNIYDYNLFDILNDINFVAINETDKYITAKRMHGWGN